MKKKYKFFLKIISFAFIVVALVLVAKKFIPSNEITEAKVIDSIDSFNYTLEDRDTSLMKDNYNELKDILKEKELNKEDYAKSIAKLFIIDLFTIDNKNNKYDVGGVEYVYPEVQENFKLNVENTLYKTVQVKNNRTEDLPVVKSIETTSVTTDTYTYNEESFSAYVVTLAWEYTKDLGYDKKAQVTCIWQDNYMYVVEYKAIGE